jgi:F1F0 ATPase subunit 2
LSAVVILIPLLGGVALGIFFYGGLWLTVRSLPGSHHPALLTMGSLWGRTLAVLTGFFFLMDGRWENAVLGLFGFTLGRFAILKAQPRGPTCT